MYKVYPQWALIVTEWWWISLTMTWMSYLNWHSVEEDIGGIDGCQCCLQMIIGIGRTACTSRPHGWFIWPLRRRGSQRGQKWAGKNKEDNDVCWGIGLYIEGKKEGAENLFSKTPQLYRKLILALNPPKEKNILKWTPAGTLRETWTDKAVKSKTKVRTNDYISAQF